MTAEHVQGDEPLIPMPALTLDALRQAVAAVVPSRLPEFFQEIQDALSQAGDEDSVFPIRHFYQRWGATIAIERRPSVAARLQRSSGRSACIVNAQGSPPLPREQPPSSRPGVSAPARSEPRPWRYPRVGAAASRSSMLPAMMVRMCSVMCWSGQSHQATVSRRGMSLSLYRRRMSLAGLPPTMP